MFTVVFDACVLYPAPLRDLLVQLALRDIFSARWTDAIHDEWISNLLESRPDLSREALERTRSLMNSHVRDSLVTGYEGLIPGLLLPDENDRHATPITDSIDSSSISWSHNNLGRHFLEV